MDMARQKEKPVLVSEKQAKMLGVLDCFSIYDSQRLLRILRDYAVMKTFEAGRILVDMSDAEIIGEKDEWS